MKTVTKRLFSFLLIFALLSSFVTAVSAEEGDPLCTVGELSPLEEALYLGLMASEEEIDIEGLCESRDELSVAIGHLLNAAPELFHVQNTYSISSVGGVPVAVHPDYRIAERELPSARAAYLLAIDEIASQVDPALSDYEIALFLHDVLCKKYAYDTTLSRFDAYSLLVEGTGVCQSYTLAYAALLHRFDIPVTYATGKGDGVAHIWSILTLDGVNYHVDVTWGDPLRSGKDVHGMAAHENFLLSDAAIEATGHSERANFGGITATDDRYADALLSKVESPFAFLGGDAYGMVDGSLYRFSDDLTEATLLYTVEEEWRSFGSVLTTKPAGVAAWDGMLYISTPHAILSYDPESGHTAELLSVGERTILSLFGDGQRLSYLTADDIYGTRSEAVTYLLPPAIPPCTGEHDFREYATVEPLCDREGMRYLRCSICGEKRSEVIPTLPHAYEITVVAPDYGVAGYTERLCPDCGDRVTDSYRPALPMPTVADYRAAVAAAEEAESAADLLAAVAAAVGMEPHLDPDEIADGRAALDRLIADYDARVLEINADFGQTLFSSLPVEGDLLAPTATLLGVLLLVIRRLFGL